MHWHGGARLFSVPPRGLHELLPHKTCSFTEGISKYPHKFMWCCNDAVDIMPRWIPLHRWCHILCYSFKEWIFKNLRKLMEWTMKSNWSQSGEEEHHTLRHHSEWAATCSHTWHGWYWIPTLMWVMTARQSQTIWILSQPCPRYLPSGWRLHIPTENRSQATVPFSNRLGSSSTPTMSTYVLQPRQSELMNRQLVVASSSHRTSMMIHTVCNWITLISKST